MTTLGKYELHEEIGRGGFGTVYRATDSTLKRDVALKVLHPQLTVEADFLEKFRNEARLIAALDNPHIVTIYELGEVDGRVFIAMRYIEGMSLAHYLKKKGPMPLGDVSRFIQQICSAIAHAHNQGYLHRDIKPNNILVDKEMNFYLTDFGLTRALHKSGNTSTTGAVLGTPPYIPPEIWNGQQASFQSDQYSLACVVHEVITGKQLFAGETPQEIIKNHLVKKPDLGNYPSKTHEHLPFIIQKALSKKESDRFSNVEDFYKNLLNPKNFNVEEFLLLIDDEEKTQEDRKVLEKIQAKKRRLITAGLMTLFLVLFGALIFFNIIPVRQILTPKTQLAELQTDIQAPDEIKEIEIENQATVTSQPTSTSQFLMTETSYPTNQPKAQEAVDQVQPGSGVTIDLQESGETGLVAYLYDWVGNPIKNQYLAVFTQKEDLSGNWVTDKRLDEEWTDNVGSALFDLPAGRYVLEVDLDGYNWGSASDVKGQANIQVEPGQLTRLILNLGRLKVGFLYADGSVVSDKYVAVYTQQKDISGQWIADKRVKEGWTNNAGVAEFDLTPGNYLVESDFYGYNWGDAVDVMGKANIPLKSGEEEPVIMQLGRMIVAVKDNSGNPKDNQYVAVYFQDTDINGKPSKGSRVKDDFTKNTGTVSFDLTSGLYAIEFADQIFYNVKVESGLITTTNGLSISME